MVDELAALLKSGKRPAVLVVGDVMLDRYVWGDVDRISFEAPIPVLRVDRREERLGGAGSVVAILAALEADVALAAVVGDDLEGRSVRQLLEGCGAATDCLLAADRRQTTVKERLLGRTHSRHPQQMIRVDRETSQPIDPPLAEALLASVSRKLDGVDVVLVSDYAKGVCEGELIAGLIGEASRRGVPVVVDPARRADYGCYAGCTAVVPNRVEAGTAIGGTITTPSEGLDAARRLLGLNIQSAVVKLDRDGIAWADATGRARWFPVRAREVYDITGAGDAVLSALGWALGLGCDWPEAIELANLAGGVEVERLGVAPITRADLLDELARTQPSTEDKILTLEQLQPHLRERRRLGQRIVMTNGCFDLFHPGHLASLQFARSQGDCLVVGLNSDRSARELKGGGRPLVGQQGRAEMLAALRCVDYVVVFDETSVVGLVEAVAPDVLVKSAQYGPEEVVGHEIVRRYGGQIVLAPMVGEYSTSRLIERIRAEEG